MRRFLDLCCFRYMDYREPPWADNKYEYTREYWHIVAAQMLFVAVFQVGRKRTQNAQFNQLHTYMKKCL